MNESINLTKILKYCPKGTEFYHAAYGRVWFCCINLDYNYPIRLSFSKEISDDACVTSKGFLIRTMTESVCYFLQKTKEIGVNSISRSLSSRGLILRHCNHLIMYWCEMIVRCVG